MTLTWLLMFYDKPCQQHDNIDLWDASCFPLLRKCSKLFLVHAVGDHECRAQVCAEDG